VKYQAVHHKIRGLANSNLRLDFPGINPRMSHSSPPETAHREPSHKSKAFRFILARIKQA
jgi:hypothetical protein